MASLPKNFPALLRAAGLNVVEVDNWYGNARPGSFSPVGSLNHHTGASAKGWSRAKELAYARWMFRTGRADLPAPLCQIALGRSGVVYLGASGRANHAGTARASGSVSAGDGNSLYIGTEWMLSGTEAIPAVMLQTGIKLNAVITEKVTGTSAATVSAHYQTSITGKWDIGDPNGIPYKNVRVLDMDKFRAAVDSARDELYGAPATPAPGEGFYDVKVGHYSGLYSSTYKQWAHDLDVIMTRGYAWITGTEAGENGNWREVRRAAKRHGYIARRYKSNWIVVDRSVVKKGTFRGGVQTVVDNDLVHGPGHDTSYLWVSFTHRNHRVGDISVAASHYPTKGRPDAKRTAGRVNLRWTKMIGLAVSEKAAQLGQGKALAFYGGDQNIVDRNNDTFFGGPLITSWDELKKWPNTGHGNIDVIARLRADKRVTALRARAFTDRQLFLYSDHYLIQTVYRIALR